MRRNIEVDFPLDRLENFPFVAVADSVESALENLANKTISQTSDGVEAEDVFELLVSTEDHMTALRAMDSVGMLPEHLRSHRLQEELDDALNEVRSLLEETVVVFLVMKLCLAILKVLECSTKFTLSLDDFSNRFKMENLRMELLSDPSFESYPNHLKHLLMSPSSWRETAMELYRSRERFQNSLEPKQ